MNLANKQKHQQQQQSCYTFGTTTKNTRRNALKYHFNRARGEAVKEKFWKMLSKN